MAGQPSTEPHLQIFIVSHTALQFQKLRPGSYSERTRYGSRCALAKKTKEDQSIESNLSQIRQKRGLSASHIAALVGVTRQTIYAIEAGAYVPNTAVALALSRVLEVRVEDLFRLAEAQGEATRLTQRAILLAGEELPAAGQPVQLCRVDSRLVCTAPVQSPWHLPESDGSFVRALPGGRAEVEAFDPDEMFSGRLLLAGCDPAVSLLTRYLRESGAALIATHRNSTQSLSLLKDKLVHIAGMHLQDGQTGEWNLPNVRQAFPKGAAVVVTFGVWEQGLVVAPGNPKSIADVSGLSKRTVSFVNREEGSGSRVLLDRLLLQAKIQPSQVRGYQAVAHSHLAAANQVKDGLADAAIATRAASRALGLGFVPLLRERYDLVFRKTTLEMPAMQILLDTLTRTRFRRELSVVAGYETALTGQQQL